MADTSPSARDAWLRGIIGLSAAGLVAFFDERTAFAFAVGIAVVSMLMTLTELSLRSPSRLFGWALVSAAAAAGGGSVLLLGDDAHAWVLLLPLLMSITDRFGRAMTLAAAVPIVVTGAAMLLARHGAGETGLAVMVLSAVAAAPWGSAAVVQRQHGLSTAFEKQSRRVERLQDRSRHLQAELREGSDAIRRTRRDLTAAIERVEARHSSILRAVGEGVLTVDPDGTITTSNPAAANLFALELEEMAGRQVQSLIPSFKIDAILAELGSAGRFGRPLQMEARRGSLIWDAELVLGTLDQDEGWLAVTVLIRDVTERARIERMKDELIATISHELRTPLTGVLGALGLLQGRIRNDVKSARLAELAHRNARRLNRLVEDIVDVQRIEAGRFQVFRERVTAQRVLDAAFEQATLRGAGREVQLRAEPAPGLEVSVDLDRLGQALAHLIINAEKHAPAETAVVLRAVSVDGGDVRFEVVDQGPGLTETQLTRVFRKFEVVDGSDRRTPGGAGVGLTIARAVAEAHGGVLGVDSESSEGAIFFVSVGRER